MAAPLVASIAIASTFADFSCCVNVLCTAVARFCAFMCSATLPGLTVATPRRMTPARLGPSAVALVLFGVATVVADEAELGLDVLPGSADAPAAAAALKALEKSSTSR